MASLPQNSLFWFIRSHVVRLGPRIPDGPDQCSTIYGTWWVQWFVDPTVWPFRDPWTSPGVKINHFQYLGQHIGSLILVFQISEPLALCWVESIFYPVQESTDCPIQSGTQTLGPWTWLELIRVPSVDSGSWPTTCSKNQSNEWQVWRKYFCSFIKIKNVFFDRKNSNQSNCSYLWNSIYWRCLIKNLENTKNENNGPRFSKIQFWKLKNQNLFRFFFEIFEMARKWLNIEIIGHKWTQKEYKKGRSIGISKDRLRGFSKKFSQK